MVVTEIKRWGNSQGLRLSRELLAQLQVAVGDKVDVAVRDGTLVITPARRVRGGHDLRDLARRMPKGHKPRELDWGPPAGREEW
jgi:antitoxin MazE